MNYFNWGYVLASHLTLSEPQFPQCWEGVKRIAWVKKWPLLGFKNRPVWLSWLGAGLICYSSLYPPSPQEASVSWATLLQFANVWLASPAWCSVTCFCVNFFLVSRCPPVPPMNTMPRRAHRVTPESAEPLMLAVWAVIRYFSDPSKALPHLSRARAAQMVTVA